MVRDAWQPSLQATGPVQVVIPAGGQVVVNTTLAPTRRGEWFFSTKNDGLQNQSVWYIQKGLDGTPELLLDPNKFSADGTSRLGSLTISHSGVAARLRFTSE